MRRVDADANAGKRCLHWITYCKEQNKEWGARGHANELRLGREYTQSYLTLKTMPRNEQTAKKNKSFHEKQTYRISGTFQAIELLKG